MILLSFSIADKTAPAQADFKSSLPKRAFIQSKDENTQPGRDNDGDPKIQVIDELAVEVVESDVGVGEEEDVYILYDGDGTTDDG